MRAFAVPSFGAAPAVHDLPVPAAQEAFLIRVRYAGVNPMDNNSIARLTADSAYPFVLGVDFAGVVERAPAPGSDLQVGDRVFGMARSHGSYADYTAVRPDAARPANAVCWRPVRLYDGVSAMSAGNRTG